MTREEFDGCCLPRRLPFNLVEAARLILVHDTQPANAAVMCGLTAKGDDLRIAEAVDLFVLSLKNN